MSKTAILLRKEHLENLPKRPADGHKGTFGRVLVIAGSKYMCGASYLSSYAAYKAGAGLVEILAPIENRIILNCLLPEAIITTYSDADDFLNKLQISAKKADSVVFGPGFGRRDDEVTYLDAVCSLDNRLIIDADGLNILSDNPSYLKKLPPKTIITPHIVEFSRLVNRSAKSIKEDKAILSAAFAKKYNLIVVLKDHETIIATPGGGMYVNRCGNSGMATGGSGDVLSGIIGALLAFKKVNKSMAAALGVLMHAVAGDRAAQKEGERAVIARDIANNIE